MMDLDKMAAELHKSLYTVREQRILAALVKVRDDTLNESLTYDEGLAEGRHEATIEREVYEKQVASLKRERDELQERETMRLLADNMPEATVPIGRKLLDSMKRERDALRLALDALGGGLDDYWVGTHEGKAALKLSADAMNYNAALDAQQPDAGEKT